MLHFTEESAIADYPNTCNITRLSANSQEQADIAEANLTLKTKLMAELIARLTKNPEQIKREVEVIDDLLSASAAIRHSLVQRYKDHYAPMSLKAVFKHCMLCVTLLSTMRQYRD